MTEQQLKPAGSVPVIADDRDQLGTQAVALPSSVPSRRVRLDVTCSCGTPIGTWHDQIAEKYPFWCDFCGVYARDGQHPWTLTATIEETP